jgi:mycofactocin system glycosyltransferase
MRPDGMTPNDPKPDGLPAGALLTVDGTVRRFDGGRALLGGSPLRVLRLTEAGVRLVNAWADGEPVAAGPGQQLARRLVEGGLAHPHYPAEYASRDVTAVIPVRGADPRELRATLTAEGVAAILVVDDGSPVRIPNAAVRHDRPRGPAAARNAGWLRAGTDLVAFIDADCRPERGWLDPLLPHFTDPRVVAVAPRIASEPGPSLLARYEAARSSLDLGPLPGPVRPGSRTSYVPTAALLVRRAALENAGGFDELLRYGEDVDLVWRLVQRGHSVRYEPASTVWHAPRPSLPAWLVQRYRYGTSAAPLADRHGRAVAPVRVSRWSAAAWTLAATGRPLTGVLTAAGTAALLPRKLRPTGVPARDALSLAARGHLYAGSWLAGAALRAWWPAMAILAARNRRARRVLAASTVPYVLQWRQDRPPLPLAPYVALRLADDLAYGAGVWAGCWRHRSAAALRPDLSDWPGRNGIQQA